METGLRVVSQSEAVNRKKMRIKLGCHFLTSAKLLDEWVGSEG